MMFSFTIFVYWSALYSHFKCQVSELFNMNVKNIIAWIHTNITNLSTIKDFSKKNGHISRDLLTQYLFFKILRTMSSSFVPNFDSAPFSMPKL